MSDQYDQETDHAADVPEEESIDEVLERIERALRRGAYPTMMEVRQLACFSRYARMHLTDGQLDESTRILNQK